MDRELAEAVRANDYFKILQARIRLGSFDFSEADYFLIGGRVLYGMKDLPEEYIDLINNVINQIDGIAAAEDFTSGWTTGGVQYHPETDTWLNYDFRYGSFGLKAGSNTDKILRPLTKKYKSEQAFLKFQTDNPKFWKKLQRNKKKRLFKKKVDKTLNLCLELSKIQRERHKTLKQIIKDISNV